MQFVGYNESMGWPAEMQVRVAAHPEPLLELLWLQHQAVGGAGPDLPTADLPGEPVLEGDPFLVSAWQAFWDRAIEHTREVHELDPRLVSTRPDLWAAPHAAELADRVGMSTREPLARWRQGLHNNVGAEFAASQDLRRAWEAGLRVVIDIPVRGEFSVKVVDSTLLVSTGSRSNTFAYGRALTRFVRA